MYILLIIFLFINFINFFLLFQSETFVLFFSFFIIVSSFYAFFNINLKDFHLENLRWLETVRFYLTVTSWHKCYIRLNELKVIKFYNLIKALKSNLFHRINTSSDLIIKSHTNNLKKTELLRLAHLEQKLKVHKEFIRLYKKNLKYKLFSGNI